MNSNIPFDNNGPYGNFPDVYSNDPLVDKLIGNAYYVVRSVYLQLGKLEYLYNRNEQIEFLYKILNEKGMVFAVKTEEELSGLSDLAEFARIYNRDELGKRQVIDYLFDKEDNSGIRPKDETRAGSWIVVNISGKGNDESANYYGSYLPWIYNAGSANGGETSIVIPADIAGVPFVIINDAWQFDTYQYTYDPETGVITFKEGIVLEEGDFVAVMRTGVPGSPDNPNISNWITVNWLYNNGYANGGEKVINIPYSFQSIPAIYKNGKRYYKNLKDESYTVNVLDKTITLTEPLSIRDRLIVQIGGQTQELTIPDRTIEEIARASNVKDSEVILSNDLTNTLDGKSVIYDVNNQVSYKLPVLTPGSGIASLVDGVLTYSPSMETVTLVKVNHTDSINGFNFTIGAELKSVNDHIYDPETKSWYFWTGGYPKNVNAGDRPVGEGWNSLEKIPTIANGSTIGDGASRVIIGQNIFVNWKVDGDFSLTPHRIASISPISDLLEIKVVTDKGEFTFVSEVVNELRGGQLPGYKRGSVVGWGYQYANSVEELGDKELAFDNTPSIQAAYDYCDEVDFPANSVAAIGLKELVTWGNAIEHKANLKVNGNYTHLRLKDTAALRHYTAYRFEKYKRNAEVSDLYIEGAGTIRPSGGEWGHGFYISSFSNLTLRRCTASNFHGDGFVSTLEEDYRGVTNTGIVLDHCSHFDNGRQGLSIIAGQVTVINNESAFTIGTDPMSGIDIEPEANRPADLDVKIIGGCFRENNGAGILVALFNAFRSPLLPGKSSVDINILIDGAEIIDNKIRRSINTSVALRVVNGPEVYDTSAFHNKLNGRIQINNVNIIRPYYGAIAIDDHYSQCIPIYLNNVHIEDVGYGVAVGETVPTIGLIAFGFRAGNPPTDTEYSQGKVVIDGLHYRDTKSGAFSQIATASSHRVKRPFFSRTGIIKSKSSWLTVNDFTTNVELADGPFLFWNLYGADLGGRRVKYTVEGNSIPTTTDAFGAGVRIELVPNSTSSTQVAELPVASTMLGCTVEYVRKIGTVTQLQFRGRSGIDSIKTRTGTIVPSVTTSVDARGVYRFYAVADGLWEQV